MRTIRTSARRLASTLRALPDADDAARLYAWRRWRDESGAVLTEISKGIAVKKPACPTLVIVGDQDTDIPPSTGRAIARELNADLTEFEGMSHLGPLLGTRAPEVAQSVLAWLEANIR